MFEYMIVFVVVAAAFWFVGRRLWKDSKSQGCGDCTCKKDQFPNRLIQIKPIDRKKY